MFFIRQWGGLTPETPPPLRTPLDTVKDQLAKSILRCI